MCTSSEPWFCSKQKHSNTSEHIIVTGAISITLGQANCQAMHQGGQLQQSFYCGLLIIKFDIYSPASIIPCAKMAPYLAITSSCLSTITLAYNARKSFTWNASN